MGDCIPIPLTDDTLDLVAPHSCRAEAGDGGLSTRSSQESMSPVASVWDVALRPPESGVTIRAPSNVGASPADSHVSVTDLRPTSNMGTCASTLSRGMVPAVRRQRIIARRSSTGHTAVPVEMVNGWYCRRAVEDAAPTPR
jgi:hypothetical protein